MDFALLSDREIVDALLARDPAVTRWFLYRKCAPLFIAAHKRYFTDCDTWLELANEIYMFIMVPGRDTGRSKLTGFGFRCTVTQWLKIVTENYCRQLYARRLESDENIDVADDRNQAFSESLSENPANLDMEDLKKILAMMPNRRYSRLIELRYVDDMSNEETADALGMSMANYYNKHRLAKEQFNAMLRKEGLI